MEGDAAGNGGGHLVGYPGDGGALRGEVDEGLVDEWEEEERGGDCAPGVQEGRC